MVPRKSEDDEEFSLKYINSGMFSTSELSILQARKEISNFGFRIEKITDDLELEISLYLTNVAEGEISHESSKKIRAMIKMIDEMESIGDEPDMGT